MPVSEILWLGLLWLVVALGGTIPAQFVKWPLKARHRKRVRRLQLANPDTDPEILRGEIEDSAGWYRYLVRLTPIALSPLVAISPGAWPADVLPFWRFLLSATAALCSPVVYHAVKGELPEIIDSASDWVRKVGGMGEKATPEKVPLETDTIETLDGR
jgi:hypothetical protein